MNSTKQLMEDLMRCVFTLDERLYHSHILNLSLLIFECIHIFMDDYFRKKKIMIIHQKVQEQTRWTQILISMRKMS